MTPKKNPPTFWDNIQFGETQNTNMQIIKNHEFYLWHRLYR